MLYTKILQEDMFIQVKELADTVFGVHYLTLKDLEKGYELSCSKGLCSSLVLFEEDELIGIRLTYAPKKWDILEQYNPSKWKVPASKVCYFKTNAIKPEFSGQGLGTLLLKESIEISEQQGASAGVADIWLNSPHNSAYKYFSKMGGEVINISQNRWTDYHTDRNPCSRCGPKCNCLGAEMILYFKDKNYD